MIDQYINRNTLREPEDDTINYTVDQALERIYTERPYEQSNGELRVMFSAWHHSPKYYGMEAHRGMLAGATVLTIVSAPQVIEANPHRVLQSYDALSGGAAAIIEDRAKNFDRVTFFASSSGNVALSAVAGLIPEHVDAATMLAPGHSMADSMWFGGRTVKLREQLEQDGWTFEALAEKLDPLTTKHNVHAFAGKPVQFMRSTRDLNVRPQSQRNYVAELREAGALLDERVSHLGHYASIGKFLKKGFK